jgi:hypothetical protein
VRLSERLGWLPSRFLADRAEAERAYALAEQLGSVNAAAAELGTTWPSLREAFTRHGLGMPAHNPEAIRQRAIDAARRRTGQPAAPALDPVFVALNRGRLPASRGPHAEQGLRLRRAEEIKMLNAGNHVGADPADRGKPGSKIHLVCEGSGLPPTAVVMAANISDVTMLTPAGRRRTRPGKLDADKGYDRAGNRAWLRRRGITARIARRGIESSQRLGGIGGEWSGLCRG